MQGESSSGIAVATAEPPLHSTSVEPANVERKEDEDGYDSESSMSSIDSDKSGFFDSSIQFEKKSPSKRGFDDAPPLNKAHSEVFKKLVSATVESIHWHIYNAIFDDFVEIEIGFKLFTGHQSSDEGNAWNLSLSIV